MLLMRKKILVAVLLLAVAAPLFFSGVFLLRHKLIQHEMEEQLETASLQTLTLPATTVTWVKKDKEVLINGRLFDVKSISFTQNNITLTGLFDTDEDDLMAAIKDATQQNNNTPLHQLAVKCLFQPLYNQSASFHIQTSWVNVAKHFSAYIETLAEPCYNTTVPPPKI
jgi:hypothetical protein